MDADLLEIPDNLRRALSEDDEEPLVVIAAMRVLRRFPWQGESLRFAQYYLSYCPRLLREETEKREFFPLPQLRPSLRKMLEGDKEEDRERSRRVLQRAVDHFVHVREERILDPPERAGVEEALRFLDADVRDDTWFSRETVQALPSKDLKFLVTGAFARTVFEAYDADPDERQALGNEIAKITWLVREELGSEVFPLFVVFYSLFQEAQGFWLQWQEEHERKGLPNFIPTYAGHLSVSWQVAWAASAAGPKQFLRFLDEALNTRDARQRLAALNFTELAIRYGYEHGTPEFGGGTVAPDVPGIEVSGGPTPVSAPPPEAASESKGVASKLGELGEKALDYISDVISRGTAAYKRVPEGGSAGQPAPPQSHPKESSKEDTGEYPIPQITPAAPVGAEKAPLEPGKRYADFTFYRRGNQERPRAEVGPNEPLAKTESYDLEVAVRTQPTGIPMRDPKETREGISEPQQGKAVDVLVIASSADFDIPEPVQRLRLPPSGNSTENAVFKELRPLRTTPSKDDLAKINVRLLYNLNLLEHAIIDAEVVSSLEGSPVSSLGLEKTIGLHQDLNFREYRNFELIQPRRMNIFVKGIQGGFELAFTFLREGKSDIVLKGTTRVFETSLEGTLAGIRKTLLGISVWEDFANGIACKDSAKFEAGLRVLAQDGRDLWTKLFELDVEGALFKIGDWLKNHPLPEASLIQVSIDRSASRFVLPWNLLYDRDLGDGPPDPKGFWGLRYQIEQETDQQKKKDDAPAVPAQPLEIGFLVSRFHEAALQGKFLNGMASASKGRIAKVVPIDTAKDALDYLQNHAKQFVLFFAHGHTQFPEAARVGASEADFLTQYEKLPKKSVLRKTWAEPYASIKKKKYDSDKSWIKLQHGKMFLLDLYAKIGLKFSDEPMVLLNMCESAQLTPSLQESFIHFFLNRGARVVIGTECSMRPLFAHHFAMELMLGILSGEAVGDVMLEARLNFMQKNNPLGLAYTLFGSPLTRFQPPPLENQTPGNPQIAH